MCAGDLAEGALQGVFHATAHDEQREVRVAVFAGDPAVAISGRCEFKPAWGAQGVTQTFFDFGAEPDEAAVGDGVFEPGVFAVGAVAVVALDEHDFLGDVDDLIHRAEAEDIREARVGFDLVVRHAEAAADGHIETKQFLAGRVGDRDEAEIVSVDVDVVARRDGDDRFEFTRQIRGAVQRFVVGFAAGDEFIGNPDLVVGAGARREVIADGFGEVERLGVEGALLGVGVRHDVAVDVAAGREGVHELSVDRLNGWAEVALENAMKLEGLTRGNLERAVGVGVGEGVEGEPLRGRADAARDANARHKGERFFLVLAPALVAEVAVVLGVDAVEFGELGAVLGDRAGRGVGEIAEDVAAEKVTLGFDRLVFGERLGRRGGGCSRSGHGERSGEGGAEGLSEGFDGERVRTDELGRMATEGGFSRGGCGADLGDITSGAGVAAG